MQFYGQLPDNFNVVINGNHPLVAEILGEVEASYGDKLKTTNKNWMRRSPSSAVSKSWSKTRRRKIFRRKKKDKQQEVDKKVEDLRRQRTERLTEIGRENKLVKQVVDLALLSNSMLKGGESDQLYPSQRGTDREIGFSHFRYVKARILVVDYVFFIESEGTKRNSRGGLREL